MASGFNMYKDTTALGHVDKINSKSFQKKPILKLSVDNTTHMQACTHTHCALDIDVGLNFSLYDKTPGEIVPS